MYMRMVQMKLEPDNVPEFHKNYDERVFGLLKDMPGCLYAGLLESTHTPGECISLTLWDKSQSAEAYERGGAFNRLMEGVGRYLAPSSEWRVQLKDDLTMGYEPVPEEPKVDAYEVTPVDRDKAIPSEKALFVRIVAPEIRPESGDEFQKIYNEEIFPALRAVQGLRYAYLTRSESERTKFLSVTLWDSGDAAAAYEQSGLFRTLSERMRPTLSDIYQWRQRMQDEKSRDAPVSEHLSVEGFIVVAGRRFV
jgi:heme-degrading monooxygenase HmoA